MADTTCDETKRIFLKYSCFARRHRRRKRLDHFHVRLKQLFKHCSFYGVDREIKSQIIHKCQLSKAREKDLIEPHIMLAELIKHGRTLEATTEQGDAMAGSSVNNGDGEVHKVSIKPQHGSTIGQITLTAKSNPAGAPLLA